MLCRSGGGNLDNESLVIARDKVAGRVDGRSVKFSADVGFLIGASFSKELCRPTSGGVLSLALSNRAAIAAVLVGRTVFSDELETFRAGDARWRVGELGGSGAVAVPRVFSHEGGF